MGNFNRGRSGGGRGFSSKGGPSSGWERRGFNSPRFAGGAGDRGSRGPAEMHPATCDKCRQNCEVPFRPTQGKPVYCSNCFDRNRNSDSRDDRQMFEATCDECRNTCQVPFQPSSGKPVYCSNCFGEKKGAGDRSNGSSQVQHTELFEALNNKLDKILALLTPNTFEQPVAVQEIVAEVTEKEPRVAKKRTSKKK